ncbi:hypothetical protein GCM10010276_81090 [Streptomyces longisporus]|uniref:Uncharacterized protein n=2 Tax=Streptomyces longisporus TaxID=1948 RepID=A0ABN3NCK3_STRLO
MDDLREGRRPPAPTPPAGELPMRYEIRVEGHMSETLTKAFPELGHVVMSGQTVLFGPVVDEGHLYGLLARFQSLGLRVLEMRQLPEDQVD